MKRDIMELIAPKLVLIAKTTQRVTLKLGIVTSQVARCTGIDRQHVTVSQ